MSYKKLVLFLLLGVACETSQVSKKQLQNSSSSSAQVTVPQEEIVIVYGD